MLTHGLNQSTRALKARTPNRTLVLCAEDCGEMDDICDALKRLRQSRCIEQVAFDPFDSIRDFFTAAYKRASSDSFVEQVPKQPRSHRPCSTCHQSLHACFPSQLCSLRRFVASCSTLRAIASSLGSAP